MKVGLSFDTKPLYLRLTRLHQVQHYILYKKGFKVGGGDWSAMKATASRDLAYHFHSVHR